MTGFGFPPLTKKKNPFAIDWDEVHRYEEEERKLKETVKKAFARPNSLEDAATFGMSLSGFSPNLDADQGMEPLRPDDPLLADAALAAADPAKVEKFLGENPSPQRRTLVAAAALHDQNSAEPYFGLQKVVAAPDNRPGIPPAPQAHAFVPQTRVPAPMPMAPAPLQNPVSAPYAYHFVGSHWSDLMQPQLIAQATSQASTPGTSRLQAAWDQATGQPSEPPPHSHGDWGTPQAGSLPPYAPWRESLDKDPTWLQAGPEPTWRESIASWMRGGHPSLEHEKLVARTMGTTGIGETGIGAIDFVPFFGTALQLQESLQHGDRFGFAMAAAPGPFGFALKKGFKTGSKLLGEFATTTREAIVDATKSRGGYIVNLVTGKRPTEGLLVSKFSPYSPRNTVIDGSLTEEDIGAHVAKNARALSRPDNYLRTWHDPATGKTHLEVAQVFPEEDMRRAAKTGERRGQTSGVNLGTGQSFPIGNWDEFIASPEFHGRLDELAKEGAEYLSQFPTQPWWKTRGTSIERVYGSENLPQFSGFAATSSQKTSPAETIQATSEYMRRHIKGEPTLQPDFRVPETAMGGLVGPGGKMPLEWDRRFNLETAASGNYQDLRGDKVRGAAASMMDDPDAAPYDRHWARIAEDPSLNIFTDTREGVIPHRGGPDRPSMRLHRQVALAAERVGEPVNVFAAKVWVGMRERIRKEGEAFGQKYESGGVRGESKAFADHFDDLLIKKAKHLNISVLELERRLRDGDAELLSFVLAAPLGAALLGGALTGPYAADGEGGGS